MRLHILQTKPQLQFYIIVVLTCIIIVIAVLGIHFTDKLHKMFLQIYRGALHCTCESKELRQ